MADREQYWISYYGTYHNGYNATLGGDGAILYNGDEMIQMYNDGLLIKEIAEKLKCDPAIVSKYLRRSGVNTSQNRDKWEEQRYVSLIMYDKETHTAIYTFPSCIDAGKWLVDNGYLHGSAESAGRVAGRAACGERPQAYGFLWEINSNK